MKQCVQLVLAIAASLFVGLLVIAVLFTNVELTEKLVANFAVASVAVGALIFVPSSIHWWAERVKEEHERKVDDGSLNFRVSQVRYIVALLVIGVMAVLMIWVLLHYRGRGG